MKFCAKCRRTKPFEAFGKNRGRDDGLSVYCRECQTVVDKERRPRGSEARFQQVLWRYNMKIADYMAILEAQNFNCGVCYTPAKSLSTRLHVDHNYVTGCVRGLLCPRCNMAAGDPVEGAFWALRLAAYIAADGPARRARLDNVEPVEMPWRPVTKIPRRQAQLYNLCGSMDGGPLYAPFAAMGRQLALPFEMEA